MHWGKNIYFFRIELIFYSELFFNVAIQPQDQPKLTPYNFLQVLVWLGKPDHSQQKNYF